MTAANNPESINDLIKSYSADFDYSKSETSVILAAGHGKRIKSQTSKMLHKIWGKSTVIRVAEACKKGLGEANLVIVVGIKADEVISSVGKMPSVSYAYQEVQLGTGHALQVALQNIDMKKFDGTLYVFPGDMGLIDADTVAFFKNKFAESGSDMLVLTGLFEGKPEENYYGRIVRVKQEDSEGNTSGEDSGKVIEIIEYKDIMNLPEDKPYTVAYKGRNFSYTKRELIENPEFNSGVYAFDFKKLSSLIFNIKNDNVQKEIYLTDLIYLFNSSGFSVDAVSPASQHVIMGFNNKSVLKEMEAIARKLVYEKLKDIVMIDDPDDFFIHDDVVDQIIEMDKKGMPLDIRIGKGAYIGSSVKLNYNLKILKNVCIDANVEFGENVILHENVLLSGFQNQKMIIGCGTEILWGNIIKGNVEIGENCRIESGVRITGSDEFATRIGSNVTVKGLSYIFGSTVEDNFFIEHSVLLKKKLSRPAKHRGNQVKVKYYIPKTEGEAAVEDI